MIHKKIFWDTYLNTNKKNYKNNKVNNIQDLKREKAKKGPEASNFAKVTYIHTCTYIHTFIVAP